MSAINAVSLTSTSISSNVTPTIRLTSSTQQRFSQEGRIRLRLLHSLGIESKHSILKNIQPRSSSMKQREFFYNYTKPVSAPFLQPLQDSVGGIRATSTFSTTLFAYTDTKRHKFYDILVQERPHKSSINSKKRNTIGKVRFDNDVLVVPIPSRHAYSERIKNTIWRNRSELHDIVERNRYEFTVEGWEWNKVLEDEDMYVDIATGEKVHPCWVELKESGDFGKIQAAIT